MRLLIAGGTTETAKIEGISAAGADSALMAHTPSADLEIVSYGRTVLSPTLPVSPTGCPTPAVITRAVREVLGFDLVLIDAGLARPTGAPTVGFDRPSDDRERHPATGGDIRTATPVPGAGTVFDRARAFATALPDDELLVGETIPGGTTTALGVLSALGERPAVSSSLPENPISLKREVVEAALAASGLEPGDAAGDPIEALESVGDPVLATVAGLVVGAIESGTDVTLAGGTQLAAAAALVRHAGVGDPIELATTSFVAEDETAAVGTLASDLDLSLSITDPGFDAEDHPAMDAYVRGEAKEGVGMGGALALAHRSGVPTAEIRDRIRTVYDRLVPDASACDARTHTEPDGHP